MLDDIVKGAVEGLIRGILARGTRPAEEPGEPAEQFEAKSFVLRDDQGRGRAVLAMLEHGPGLTLLDDQEEVKAILCLGKEGAYLQHWGSDDKTNIVLRIDDNEPELLLCDAANEPRASLRLMQSGPNLQLRDAAGHCRVQLEMDEEGGPTLTLYDENEEAQVVFPETADPAPKDAGNDLGEGI